MTRPRKRGNGEGSIYPVDGGYRGYVWVTGTDGIRRRKYVKGRTYEETQDAWLGLHTRARSGPIAAAVPTITQHFAYWLAEVVEPNLAPKTYEKTRCSPASTSCPAWEPSASTGSRPAISGHGSTGCALPASAAPRAKTPPGQTGNNAVARSAGAADSTCQTEPSKTSGTPSGPHSPTLWPRS